MEDLRATITEIQIVVQGIVPESIMAGHPTTFIQTGRGMFSREVIRDGRSAVREVGHR
jgi:hypothetical protein